MLTRHAHVAAALGAAIAATGCSAPSTSTPNQAPTLGPSCAGDIVVRDTVDAARLEGCQVLASLTIRGAGAIDLSGLASVRAIRGDLIIGPTTQLSGLVGLGELTEVGGSLKITSNFQLSSAVIGSLTSVGRDVVLESNISLIGVSLSTLSRVGGNVSIDKNGRLESLLLSSLNQVGGDLRLAGWSELSIIDVSPELTVRGERHISPANSRKPRPKPAASTQPPTPTIPE